MLHLASEHGRLEMKSVSSKLPRFEFRDGFQRPSVLKVVRPSSKNYVIESVDGYWSRSAAPGRTETALITGPLRSDPRPDRARTAPPEDTCRLPGKNRSVHLALVSHASAFSEVITRTPARGSDIIICHFSLFRSGSMAAAMINSCRLFTTNRV